MIEHMSNAELLSYLAGPKPAAALLQRFPSLSDLHRASMDELQQVAGVGETTAIRIKSALALAVRMSRESYQESPILDTPERIADLLREANRAYVVENFQVVLLNTRRRLIRTELVCTGTLDTILVSPREVFSLAITARAAALVLVHNHPSGDPTPSEADVKITRDLIRAGQLLKIEVLDHVIMGRSSQERPRDFVSLRALGYFHLG